MQRLLKVIRISDYYVLSPKQVIYISPLLSLKGHLKRKGRKDAKAK